jgi:hypothetical protein
MRIRLALAVALVGCLAAAPTASAGHGLALDHTAPAFAAPAPLPLVTSAGGPGAKWEFVDTFVTGDPHTDLDFFTQKGETYLSAGTLGAGPNGAGQTIFQLTQNGGQVDPKFVSAHPSAECPSDASQTLGLQHDVEAAPKGGAILNASNPSAVTSDTELLVDASDNPGRCHDQGPAAGTAGAPQGGLEMIDVTNVANPKEIGLTSHIGESHTVNVDPKRPHIAYSVTSDEVSVNAAGQRENEISGDNDRKDLDGFEIVDMSSCMYFPPSVDTLQERRDRCRPQVYRYRYPTLNMALGHTQNRTVFGCHELEVYRDDRLTCGSGGALIVLDMRGAFDTRGTKSFLDDRPRGSGGPMPCTLRPSSSSPPFFTGAMVTDCVDDSRSAGKDENLDVPNWLASGKPGELLGVRYLGTVHHMGRGGPRPSTEDNDFNHEAEYSASRRLLIATDERGGGVAPPGATCTSAVDNTQGNGGVHFYRADRLTQSGPGTPGDADAQYARTPSGDKAIYRAKPRTGVEPTTCTAHVFQQVPGQNRIFMAWYSQGTQVIDFVERRDGTVELKEAGWWIPMEANQWVSHVFKVQRNADGTYTYWGATGDFRIDAGRNAVDIYKVTLPAPPAPR